MKTFLIWITIYTFLTLPSISFTQVTIKAFGAYEVGSNFSFPADLNYFPEENPSHFYSAYKLGLGLIKPFFKKEGKSLAIVAETYFKSYYTGADISLDRFGGESYRFNANYIGISAGLQFKSSKFIISLQPYAAYMIYNEVELTTSDGKKELSLSNEGDYAINYLNYGIMASVGIMFPVDKPRFGVKFNYPFSISKLYDGASDNKIYNNRWFSLCEIQLEYYF